MTLTDKQVAELNALPLRLNQVVLGGPDTGWPWDVPLGTLLAQLAPAPAPSSARLLKVDPENGNDADDGMSNSTALKTIQCAVLKLKPPTAGPQLWLRHDDRTIEVLFTPGMADITERVVIPPHAGAGFLIIQGDERVVASGLVMSAPLSAVAGKETQQTMTFTTTPLAVGALNNAAFIRLSDRSLEPTAFEAALNDVPVRSNLAGSCKVIAADPGVFCAFSLGAGAVVDVVEPQVVWSLPANADARLETAATAILNVGGSPLIVSGFVAKAPADASSTTSNVFLTNAGSGYSLVAGPPVVLNRCTMRGDVGTAALWSVITSGPVTLSGVQVEPDSIFYVVNEASNYALYNMNANVANSFTTVQLQGIAFGFVSGLNAEGCSIFMASVNLDTCSVDLDATGTTTGTGAFALYDDVSLDFTALTVINAGLLAAVSVGSHHGGYKPTGVGWLDATRVSGSTGNLAVGVTVGTLASLHTYGNVQPTLTGAGGDLKVGALAARPWGSGSQTDPTDLSIFD